MCIRDSHKDELAKKFKDNNSPLKIAIVVDMWLTGFDVPSLATMYVYKPMSGHNLMQAIARVNRVFRDKEGGLVVDYVGIATALKKAMNDYTCLLYTSSKRKNFTYKKSPSTIQRKISILFGCFSKIFTPCLHFISPQKKYPSIIRGKI